MVFAKEWENPEGKKCYPAAAKKAANGSLYRFVANKISYLRLSRDFQRLFEKGVAVRKRGVIFRAVWNNGQNLRLAFGLSRKNIKRAVKRNKIKRWSRECLKKHPDLKKKNLDMLIISLSAGWEYESFKALLDELVQKAVKQLAESNSLVSP